MGILMNGVTQQQHSALSHLDFVSGMRFTCSGENLISSFAEGYFPAGK